MNNRTVTVDDLLQCYVRDNNCRDIMQARTALECAALEARAHLDEQTRAKGLLLLEGLREWDERQKQKQQVNTQAPPPPKQTYNAQQTNSASPPPQTNTAQVYPDGYNTASALLELLVLSAKGGAIFATLYFIGAACVNAAKGIGAGIATVFETVTPYLVYFGAGSIALIALYEGLRKKETPTVPNGATGYTINHYHYGNGTVTTQEK